MARSRNIKPGFFTNDDLADVSPLGRLLFIGLWTAADREGRLEDRPRRIKAEILPYDDADVDMLLGALDQRGFIVRYEAGGDRFIQVQNFTKHQNPHMKEPASTIPAPSEHDASTMQAPEEHSSGPADSLNLIPDSLNLIPDSLNLIPDTGYLIPDCGEARESALSPPEQTIPISEPDQNAFQRRFGKPAPFTLLAALCDELGVYTDDLSKTDRGRQEAIARKLIADGTTPDDVRRMVRWLQGQSWVTGGIDLGLIQKQRDKWVLAGKPDTASKPRSPTQSRRGFTPEELFAMAREEPDDERTRNDASFGGAEYRLAGEADHTRDDSGVPLGAGGSAIRGGQTGSGGLGAIREVVPETG